MQPWNMPMKALKHAVGSELEEADGTPGMVRAQAFSGDGIWAGTVRVAPGTASGWHHHGDYETYAEIVEGLARFEFGPGGDGAVDGGPGDFVRIPAHTVHRETNPGSTESTVVLFRVGSGAPVFNVDGPRS